jgi:hypothetical protein
MATIDTTNGSAEKELHTEDEALSVLMDADIDKVMAGLDRILEAAPSYEKLFARWQRQQWNSEDFDFTEDAKQWADPDGFTGDERQFITFGFSEFFVAENSVTVELIPFALAVPQKEAQLFLTTQIADEAKHVVFWDRFYREVFGSTPSSWTSIAASSTTTGGRSSTASSTSAPRTCARTRRTSPPWFAGSPST